MKLAVRAGVASALLLLGACHAAPDATATKPRLLPGFAEEKATLQSLQLRTAGNTVAATLTRQDGAWRVAERADWPADPVLVDNLLQALGEMRGAEAKTADPSLYARLGLEPVVAPEATGAELRLVSAGKTRRLVLGKASLQGGGSFVRIGGERGTWLADRVLVAPHLADDWLDRIVVDLPLPRVADVEVLPADAPRFILRHAAADFHLLTGASDVVADAEKGEALASVAGPLVFDTVARDDGAPAEREVRVVAEDGFVVHLAAWRREGQVWLRVRGEVDAARVQARAGQHGDKPGVTDVQARATALDARCAGYMFRLPAYPASVLMTGRESLRGVAR